MKFIFNNRTDALKTDINLFFTITSCQIIRSRSLTHRINYKLARISAVIADAWETDVNLLIRTHTLLLAIINCGSLFRVNTEIDTNRTNINKAKMAQTKTLESNRLTFVMRCWAINGWDGAEIRQRLDWRTRCFDIDYWTLIALPKS